ncbi:unnamed protein product [Rotaria sordida]|uniref:Uncharacterized protein n=1 Tax=Rotaria sordida TaxID=392033 RepID=A0A818QJQ7_9BILA|nr:unnamed protein product [Rotaria sordida]CAF3639870.1 unnamed protein product [Rotaria sordida]
MIPIQFNAQQLSSYIRTAIQLLSSNSSKVTDLMLPKILENINRIANESVIHTRTITNKLFYLPELLSEVLEMSAATYSNHTGNTLKKQSHIIKSTHNSQDNDRGLIFNEGSYKDDRLRVKNPPKEYRSLQTVLSANRILTEKATSLFTAEYASKLDHTNQRILSVTPGAATTIKDNTALKAKHLKKGKKSEKRNTEIIQQIAQSKQQSVTLNGTAAVSRKDDQEIINILLDSVAQIHKIQVQWNKMMLFFNMLISQVEHIQNGLIQNFLNIIKDSSNNNFHLDSFDKELVLILLIKATEDLEQQADSLYTMCKAYSDTSSAYIINQINSVNLLILQTNDEQASYLRQLPFNTILISTRVVQLAQDQQNEYIIRMKNRRTEYEQLLAQIDTRKVNS